VGIATLSVQHCQHSVCGVLKLIVILYDNGRAVAHRTLSSAQISFPLRSPIFVTAPKADGAHRSWRLYALFDINRALSIAASLPEPIGV
jgi:hypothetical protein